MTHVILNVDDLYHPDSRRLNNRNRKRHFMSATTSLHLDLEGDAAAFGPLHSDMADLFETEDGREGLASFVERREARFTGR